MPNQLHGPFNVLTVTNGATPINKTWGDNAQKQSSTALASFNPDLIASGFILTGVAASRHNSYASNVIADSPLRYYRMDEASGTTCQDSSGNSQPLTYYGSPTLGAGSLLTGDSDAAVTFTSASSQYAASTANTGLPTGAAALTLECWIKFAANPASNQFVLDLGDRSVATHHLAFLLLTTGAVQLSNGTTAIASGALTTGARHHLVGTYDGTNLRLYVDSTLVAGPTVAGNALGYTGNNMAIGGQSGATPGAYFDGQIDEAAVYGTALSSTRVTAHWTAATTATTQLDVSSGTAYLVQSDATVTRCDVVSSTQTTATINTTYFLDLNPDGSWSWGTSHSAVANHLTIASVATDSLGNTVAVTDLRPLNATLLPSLGAGHLLGNTPQTVVGGLTAPGVAASTPAGGITVTATTLQTLLVVSPQTAGWYRASCQFRYVNGTPQKPKVQVNWYDAAVGTAVINFLTSALDGFLLNGSQAASPGSNQTVACYSLPVFVAGGGTVGIQFQDPGGTPADVVYALLERLT